MKSLRIVLFISGTQVLLTFLASIIWLNQWKSVVAGSAISLVNFWLLFLGWLFIIYKKRVAPSVSVVVIKYGILILIFSQIPQVRWIDSNTFVFGVLINPVALVLGGILTKLIFKSRGN